MRKCWSTGWCWEYCDRGNLDSAISAGRFLDKTTGAPDLVRPATWNALLASEFVRPCQQQAVSVQIKCQILMFPFQTSNFFLFTRISR